MPNKPTTEGNICVCGNRGYSALVNNVHFKDCPCNKPTTLRESELREEFKKKFEGYWRGEAISDEICFWWLEKFKEVVDSKKLYEEDAPFEGMNDNDYKIFNSALDQVISIIKEKNKSGTDGSISGYGGRGGDGSKV